ncbi:MAG: hypothetical protein DMF84_26740 [Acidobacteria bacterium]|nr:MAG: hypothetical protein DMF84_26740 [Acidobacteriota bacterium]
MQRNARKTGSSASEITKLPYPNTFAWLMKNARRLRTPVPYRHPSGAVRWVKFARRHSVR